MSEHSINQPTEEELLRWGGRGRGLPSLPSMPSLVSGTSMGKQQNKCSASSGFSCEVGFFFNMALSTAQNGCEARLGTVLWGSGKENGVLKLKKKK